LQSRGFTYVENVVSANLKAATASDASGSTCNIGCGGRYSLLELLEAIALALHTDLSPRFLPPREGDVPHSQADISRAQRRLGYRVIVPFEEGIERTVSWYREHGPTSA
jgi:nucleoside-diphosphate-sugar epimerase